MKASELIARLEHLKKQHGDLPVVTFDDDRVYTYAEAFHEGGLTVSIPAPGCRCLSCFEDILVPECFEIY